MEQLWAPWRLAYVAADSAARPADDCFICRGLAGSDDRSSHLVHRGAHSLVLLNRYPFNNGHLLICPKAHKARLDELGPEEVVEIQETITRMIAALERIMRPDGFNIGVNLGKAAGAGVPGHLHWHLVPRWAGDTNFMPVAAGVKVIVQSLDSLYDLLTTELGK